MASGPLVGGDDGGDGSKEKHRWAESKVYTRKSYKPSSKPSAVQQHRPSQPEQQSQQTLDTATDDQADSSLHQPHSVHNNHRPQHHHRGAHGSESTASEDGGPISVGNKNGNGGKSRAFAPGNHASQKNSRHPAPSLVSRKVDSEGHRRVVINPASGPRHEVRELRNKLMEELDMVRELVRRLEAREAQLSTSTTATAGYNTHSQLSANDARTPGKGYSSGTNHLPLHGLFVATGKLENNSVIDVTEKEKRTPKANQFYRNSEFLTGKDKLPHSDSQKKSKTNGSKKPIAGQADHGTTEAEKSNAIFKSCATLLSKLMKHKHGWVFNKPVDVKGLGLHDYHIIIKQPMDLGTIRTRLNTNWYKFPREFAEDVRLTFRNAVTYNPKGQDVHIMAEQLSEIFEDHWQAIEAELNVRSYPVVNKKTPPPSLDMGLLLERSESTTHPVVPDLTPKGLSYTPHSARSSASKKPKVRDSHKRDMTYDEKQRLSNNLQKLPSEKLDLVVQIIKKRNSSLSQHDDEIEVDIDSVDTETLWELDRFVTNYKKSLSKNKRKAELAVQAPRDAEQSTKDKNEVPAVAQPPQIIKPCDMHISSSPPAHKADARADKENGSSSSSDSSTNSGSSSSDSDSESSSS